MLDMEDNASEYIQQAMTSDSITLGWHEHVYYNIYRMDQLQLY